MQILFNIFFQGMPGATKNVFKVLKFISLDLYHKTKKNALERLKSIKKALHNWSAFFVYFKNQFPCSS